MGPDILKNAFKIGGTTKTIYCSEGKPTTITNGDQMEIDFSSHQIISVSIDNGGWPEEMGVATDNGGLEISEKVKCTVNRLRSNISQVKPDNGTKVFHLTIKVKHGPPFTNPKATVSIGEPP